MVLRQQDAQFDNPDILAAYNPTHSQAGVHNAVDTNNNTDDEGSLCDIKALLLGDLGGTVFVSCALSATGCASSCW